ncbi:MAG: carbohydrate kinase [Rhodobacter sp.]|nr:carbohydrate kinase [Paracoccaceae bacterium]MCC0077131.1 carbohydrate kinase [Rhodobacter sp.]
MIYCCGEALIDMIPEPTVSGGTGFVAHPGGAVFNTAIALGRLGAAVGMVTALSTDLFGRQLAEALTTSRVETAQVIRVGRPTTLAFVTLSDGQASYAFFDENSAGRMLQPGDMPRLPADGGALFFGGISLAVEPCAEAYVALAAHESAARMVMLDPNIRPGFIQDEERYRARLTRLFALADIIKISEEDLAWLFPGADAPSRKLETLRAAGPKLVLLTQGARGATALLPDGRTVTAQARAVTVVDTVGAGDTFNAGILASLADQGLLTKPGIGALTPHHIAAALSLATETAAHSVSRAGANPPWRSELSGA